LTGVVNQDGERAAHDIWQTSIVPVVFGGIFGTIHRPASLGRRDLAVVICPPIGIDARRTYRVLFEWADTLAAEGYTVLRYDPAGEGDSGPIRLDEDQCEAWIRSAVEAAAFAREWLGCDRLVLAGLRGGGTIAMAVSDVVRPDGLIVLAPYPSGAAWLRELRLSATMLADQRAGPERLEVGSMLLSARTMATMEALDVTMPSAWRAPAFLSAPGAPRALQARLGPELTQVKFTDYARLFREAHMAQAPAEVLAAASAWLSGLSTESPAATLKTLPSPEIDGDGWTESRVEFGGGLRGIITEPKSPQAFDAVVIGNTGGDPRCGIGNFSTEACRALAARGVTALRFDFRGLGESADGSFSREAGMFVYDVPRTEDFLAAADVLQGRGVDGVMLFGVCTGGYHAVHAVLENRRFSRAVAVNAWLVRRHGTELDDDEHAKSMRAKVISAPMEVSRALHALSGDRWRLVTKRIRWLISAARSLVPDAAARAARSKFLRLEEPSRQIVLLFGVADRSLSGLDDFGVGGRWLGQQHGVTVRRDLPIDHALAYSDSRAFVVAELVRLATGVPMMDVVQPRVDGSRATADGDLAAPPQAGFANSHTTMRDA
jgi:dienelactone hydrolase